jgi:hypothetical protein
MKRRLLVVFIAVLAGARTLAAQGNFMSLTTFELSTPIGDTRRYTSVGVGPGLGWEGRWAMHERTSAGVSLTLGQFSERDNGTMQLPAGAVTGEMLRQIVTEQVLATGYFYPTRRQPVRFYAGGGLGASFIDQDFNVGTSQLSRSAWHAVIAPEVGAELRGNDGFLVGVVSLRFNAGLAAGDYLGGGSRRFQYLTLRLGFGEE